MVVTSHVREICIMLWFCHDNHVGEICMPSSDWGVTGSILWSSRVRVKVSLSKILSPWLLLCLHNQCMNVWMGPHCKELWVKLEIVLSACIQFTFSPCLNHSHFYCVTSKIKLHPQKVPTGKSKQLLTATHGHCTFYWWHRHFSFISSFFSHLELRQHNSNMVEYQTLSKTQLEASVTLHMAPIRACKPQYWLMHWSPYWLAAGHVQWCTQCEWVSGYSLGACLSFEENEPSILLFRKRIESLCLTERQKSMSGLFVIFCVSLSTFETNILEKEKQNSCFVVV